MKILYAVGAVNLPGGYDRIIIEKANYLAEHDHDVIITVASHALAKPYTLILTSISNTGMVCFIGHICIFH